MTSRIAKRHATDARQQRLQRRRIKGMAFAVAGALIAAPAIAAVVPQLVREITAATLTRGTNETPWLDGSQWRIDEATGVREVRMTMPRDPVVLPFNLFAHDGPVQDDATTTEVEGAGANRVIVPGDHGSTTVRVHNDGLNDGTLTARFVRNELHNVDRTDVGHDGPAEGDYTEGTAYDYLLINSEAASVLLADTYTLLEFDGDHEIRLAQGEWIELPFEWSFFAEGAALYNQNHNIGNAPLTQADFTLELTLTPDDVLLTIEKVWHMTNGHGHSHTWEGDEPPSDAIWFATADLNVHIPHLDVDEVQTWAEAGEARVLGLGADVELSETIALGNFPPLCTFGETTLGHDHEVEPGATFELFHRQRSGELVLVESGDFAFNLEDGGLPTSFTMTADTHVVVTNTVICHTELTYVKTIEGPYVSTMAGTGASGHFIPVGDASSLDPWDIRLYAFGLPEHTDHEDVYVRAERFPNHRLYRNQSLVDLKWTPVGQRTVMGPVDVIHGHPYVALMNPGGEGEASGHGIAEFRQIPFVENPESNLSAEEALLYQELSGRFQCFFAEPAEEDDVHEMRLVPMDMADVPAQALAEFADGRHGSVRVPLGFHVVCEHVSQTSRISVEKLVSAYDAYGVLLPARDTAPAFEWEAHLTPVYMTSNRSMNELPSKSDEFGGWRDDADTIDLDDDAPGASTGVGMYRVLPHQLYRLDLVVPVARIEQGYELVDVFITQQARPVAVTSTLAAGMVRNVAEAAFASASLPVAFSAMANTPAVAVPTVEFLGTAAGVPGTSMPASVIPGGVMRPDETRPNTRFETITSGAGGRDGESHVTYSWYLSLDQLSTTQITFMTERHEAPMPGTPGTNVNRPVELARTGITWVYVALGLAVVAAGASMATRERKFASRLVSPPIE